MAAAGEARALYVRRVLGQHDPALELNVDHAELMKVEQPAACCPGATVDVEPVP
ncbi:hypothetical protein [Streptomyces sp. WMMB 322]|uniref:hypothetical protein n=1 Tax=Streptomyces sp. WMMB 322 TaxID=1286821 RepID=UPI00131C4DAC|nr:hypothetical protein [Streptomyces sp. WMMB 322]